MSKSLKYAYDIDLFKQRDATFYYLLGAFITDGCVHAKHNGAFETSITSKDFDWLKIIRDLICKELKIRKEGNSECGKLSVYSTEISKIFISEGCIPRKSLTVKLPTIPDKYLPDFIRGCMDGDGSLAICQYDKHKGGKTYTYTKTGCYLCGASKDFLVAISDILTAKGIIHSFIKTNDIGDVNMIGTKAVIATAEVHRLTFSDSSAARFLEWVYYPNHKLSMPRKRVLADKIISINAAKVKKNPHLYR